MRVAFVLRSAEVQPLFRDLCGSALKRKAREPRLAANSPPPPSILNCTSPVSAFGATLSPLLLLASQLSLSLLAKTPREEQSDSLFDRFERDSLPGFFHTQYTCYTSGFLYLRTAWQRWPLLPAVPTYPSYQNAISPNTTIKLKLKLTLIGRLQTPPRRFYLTTFPSLLSNSRAKLAPSHGNTLQHRVYKHQVQVQPR
jgi:hypothetical protein